MSEFASSIYPIKDIFYGDVTLSSLIFVLIFGTIIAAMASVYPAYKAARLQPTEALRYV
jgi:ABC-type lipoprotein release transport system permease subunit